MSEPTELGLGQAPPGYRSGFVSLVGRPNVGKSTLLNQLMRSKVSITSDRPQTTRNTIRGILTTPKAQLVFVDTPGLHKPHTALGKRLNQAVRNTFDEVDVVVFLIDVVEGIGKGDTYIAHELAGSPTPVFAVLNKIDAVRPKQLAEAIEQVQAFGWDALGISAKTGAGVKELLAELIAKLPEGPVLYPPDVVTDQPEVRRITELIREKVLASTYEEVPHSVAVEIEEMQEDPDGKGVEIIATIFVERDSQKGIVIGKGGKMLKDIGSRARRDIEALLSRHVYLDLRVKVEADWQGRDRSISRFGYGE